MFSYILEVEGPWQLTRKTLPTPDLLTSLMLAGIGGKPVALDIMTITSPLCPAILGESCHQAGVATLAAEVRKLHSNGP